MWVCKFQFDGGDNIFFGGLAKKYNATLTGYNVSSHMKNNAFYVTVVGTFNGNEKVQEKFLDEIKNSKFVVKFEKNSNFFIVKIREWIAFKSFYSPNFIYLSPIVIDNKGIYHYHVASWFRKDIETVLDVVDKKYGLKLISLKEEPISSISLTGIQPNLTDKQKKAYELAVKSGYYDYPKRITLKELAKMMGVSYSTYQQHLSYAEKKVHEYYMPINIGKK